MDRNPPESLQGNHLEQNLPSLVEESWWHEVIRLYCAQAEATSILEACLAVASNSFEALTLAIDCVEEARNVQTAVKERLSILLEQGVNDSDSKRRRVIMEALLKRRLRQMRPLQGAIFVDTSLITCAEYQLFLDEQRAHGYNFAPDSWGGDTFPQGQGRDSLLGARVDAAQAFCRWLTDRDREGQSYRLPQRDERQQIKTSVGAGLPGGTSYWEEDGTIVWSQNGPSRPLIRQVLSDLVRDRALTHALDRDPAIARVRDLTLTHALDRDRAIASARDLARDLAHALDLDRTSDRDHALASDFAIASARDLAHSSNDLASTRDLAIGIYIILYLFVQRPRGMLPAYEGILLIKERAMETSLRPEPER